MKSEWNLIETEVRLGNSIKGGEVPDGESENDTNQATGFSGKKSVRNAGGWGVGCS